MGGNYDKWAGRDSIFKDKLSNVRTGQPGERQAKSATQSAAAARYLEQATQTTTSSMKALNLEDLERRVLKDELTGLNNSRVLMRTLSYELKRGMRYKRPLALAILAIDGLANIRANYGNDAANQILKTVSESVTGGIRDVDISARFSDNELAVIFPETNVAGLTTVAERIRQRIRSCTVTYLMQVFHLSASIGAACFPTHAKTADELVAMASQALTQAAHRGGDRLCVP